MKHNYTKQQIEEILEVMTNPEEFAGFITRMHELCSHQVSEYPEDGSYFALITDDVYEAVYLYLHPEEARKKYQEIEDIIYESSDEAEYWREEEERQREEDEYNDCQFNQWYDSLTPEQQEEYDLTGHVTE